MVSFATHLHEDNRRFDHIIPSAEALGMYIVREVRERETGRERERETERERERERERDGSDIPFNHYRARNWTFDETHFLVSSYSSFQNGYSGENRVKIFSGEVGIKCHRSCLVALVFYTKLYIKLAVSLCSFSKFSFPFNF